jgi:hypothetical protein
MASDKTYDLALSPTGTAHARRPSGGTLCGRTVTAHWKVPQALAFDFDPPYPDHVCRVCAHNSHRPSDPTHE